MNNIKLTLSAAECTLILEAITAANASVEDDHIVYSIGNVQCHSYSNQHAYAGITDAIAEKLGKIIDDEQHAVIMFEP